MTSASWRPSRPRWTGCRPIGTQVKVVPPIYVDIQLDVTLRGGSEGVEQILNHQLSAWLESAGIGGTLRAGDALALVQGAPGVVQVREVTLHTNHPGCYRSEEGDIRLPLRAIPRLGTLRVERLPDRGSIR